MPSATGSCKDFASRLKLAMQAKNITVRALNESVSGSFSPRTIFRWRSGESTPNALAMPLLAESLGVTADWLLGAEEGGPNA